MYITIQIYLHRSQIIYGDLVETREPIPAIIRRRYLIYIQ